MLKIASAALVCASLVGCTSTGALNPTATTDIQTALSVGCPILATVNALAITPNKTQIAALKTLALACPPNLPPTSAIVAVTDVIAAYELLQPLIPTAAKKSK